MAKEVMHRSAGDNAYLHRDFHGALSVGLEYLDEHYGEDAVREYLRQFALAFYAPLTDSLRRRGLVALVEHFHRVYDLEGGEIRFTLSDDELLVEVQACPAVAHMRKQGYPVARLFHETKAAVGKAICDGTAFDAELLEYDPDTGRSVQRFSRRPT